ncbi:molecular chaperone DnaJ [Rickettsiales bacterium]|nr:molecular chaperone DnaJ [Rickettsiales bacterium]
MSKRDYYDILGVNKDANADELKKSYRKQAMKYHPDRNPGDKEAEAKFKEAAEAYEILKDEQKRAAYDRYGHAAFENGGGSAGGGFGGAGFDPQSHFGDIFGDLFGDFMGGRQAGGARAAASRGSDLRYNLSISLEEAFKGKQQQIKFTTSVGCSSCNSTGSKDKSAAAHCPTCNGAGKVRMQQGFFTIERTCTSCHGAGKVIKDPCNSCAGEGRIRKEKTLSVTIPEGVEDGTRIRLSGEGEVGPRNGPAGDLYIFVSVKDHDFFIREGNDLHCQVPIKMTTAALGGDVEVPVIEGTRAKLTVNPGAQSSDKLRLRGKGMSVMRSGGRRGDMYIHLQVETPVKLSKRQKELLEEFESLNGRGTNPEVEKFFKKVKKIWSDLTD